MSLPDAFDTPEPVNTENASDNALEFFPCTPPQQRCYFLDQLDRGNPALNVAIRWELTGRFTPETVERAYRTVIARHEALRTRFVEVDGAPMLDPLPSVDFSMTVVDARDVAESEREAHVAKLAQTEVRRSFDLHAAPLIRGTLFLMEDQRALLLTVIHQSAFDGWSIRVFGREIGTCIAAYADAREPDLPELSLQYADYALWLDEYYGSAGFLAEKDYWLMQLEELPYFEVEPDKPRGPARTTNGAIVSRLLSREISDLFDARAKALGMSTFSLGSAAIAALLHRVNDDATDVVFGTQVTGRQEVDLENLIGVFINNVVLRFDAGGDPTLDELAARSGALVREALVNQRMPFHKLVEILNPPRDLRRTPLISINVIIQQAFLEDADYGAATLKGVPSPSPGALYDLNFQMLRRPDGWRMTLEYNTDLFSKGLADTLLDLWERTFDLMLTAPETKLSALPKPPARAKAPAPLSPFAAAEGALAAHPDVAEAAVAEAGGTRWAYLVARDGYAGALETLPSDVLAFARDSLAPSALPVGASVVLALPRDIDGGVDRAALPKPPAGTAPTPAAAALAHAAQAAPARAKTASPDAEAKLKAIWQDVLGLDDVPRDGHFFELGGHSLLAVRMFARVGAAFGHQPDLAALFSAPTLQDFAALLTDDDASENEDPAAAPLAEIAPAIPTAAPVSARDLWTTMAIKRGSADLPLIGVNHPMLFYKLGRDLSADRGLIGATIAKPRDAAALADAPLETIIAGCVEAIREERPHGPYALIGLCVNGVAVIEAARQLAAAGEDVALVAMIDTWKPGYYRSAPAWRRFQWDTEIRVMRFAHYVRKLLTGKMSLVAFLSNYDFARNILVRLGKARPLSAEDRTNIEVTDFLVTASRAHRPAPYDGKVVIFRSEASPKRARDLLFGWRGTLRDDTPVHDVEGWHEDSFTSAGMASLANVIENELRKVET